MSKLFTEDEVRKIAEVYSQLYVSDLEPLDDERGEQYRRDRFQEALAEVSVGSIGMLLTFRAQRSTEHEAWLAVVSEMRAAGVGDINAGGVHERLHDAITAWGEELAQLRMMDPDPAHAEAALEQRRTKYLET